MRVIGWLASWFSAAE